jgi:hypothetical protein
VFWRNLWRLQVSFCMGKYCHLWTYFYVVLNIFLCYSFHFIMRSSAACPLCTRHDYDSVVTGCVVCILMHVSLKRKGSSFENLSVYKRGKQTKSWTMYLHSSSTEMNLRHWFCWKNEDPSMHKYSILNCSWNHCQ